jgi:hypothetical protein
VGYRTAASAVLEVTASPVAPIVGAHPRAGPPGLLCVRAHSPAPDSIAQVRRSRRSKTIARLLGILQVATLAPGPIRMGLAAHLLHSDSTRIGHHTHPAITGTRRDRFLAAALHSILCRGGPAGWTQTARRRADRIKRAALQAAAQTDRTGRGGGVTGVRRLP